MGAAKMAKPDSDMRKLIAALTSQGFEAAQSRRGHYLVLMDGRKVATLSGSASDWRSWRNGLAQLRRAGFDWRR
jgi:hypothetical protein